MGSLSSRQEARGEELEIPAGSVYRFPPKSGNYFASHFIMGGQTFDSTYPEGYLFGENSDLNFLGMRPVVFPYAAPPPQDPVKTLRSLINIRKDTLRLVKCTEEMKTPGEEIPKPKICYNVEFIFDADARVAITIYYQATEEFQNGCASYTAKDSSLQSDTVHYKRGVCQQFCLPSHTIDPSDWMEEELVMDGDRTVYPMVIQAVVDEGQEHLGHSHVLLTTFDKNSDGNCSVKPLKQKQVVDGVIYLLQEIYGIENKYNCPQPKGADDEHSDNSAECVVCLSDVRDTLILPCRHLCLCNACADTLRYQANNCPICRLPFRALLQIRAMRKKVDPLTPSGYNPIIASQISEPDDHSSSDHIPLGYEAVSLLEALNGPLVPSPSAPPIRLIRDGHAPTHLPSFGPDGHTLPVCTLSPLDRTSDSAKPGFKVQRSTSKSLSQNSSILHEEDEEKSFSDGEIVSPRKPNTQELEDSGVTPESENLTLSSSGAVDQSSCTGTPLSSTITSPEDASSSLAQSVMSMASSQVSTDTISSMSGSYVATGPEDIFDGVAEEHVRLPVTEEEEDDVQESAAEGADATLAMTHLKDQDAEGNAVSEGVCAATEVEAQSDGWWLAAVTSVCDNNNEQTGLMRLDNDPCPEDAVPATALTEDRIESALSIPSNTDLKDGGDPGQIYAPLVV
ncbi:E3 ubiquitin ligase RNF157 isoform X2 [Scyliorhinus canicula]|uniref:E3 ubiquitin ligase RNF157 isoform X2 n=1 Tax=Scyliorhinus canicula TaxID=7830 RepID=UPI0018F4CEA1|nr:E3 ubiquitin ligase RNF157 isoform X2 [Scyliorhinus canicula]